MNLNINIQRLTDETFAEPVAHFLQQQVTALFPQIPGLQQRPDLLALRETYTAPRCALFFATAQAKVVGTVALRPYDDRLPDMRGVYDLPTTAEVVRCYVQAEQRGQGMGTLLLAQLEAFAQANGFETLCLHTHRHLPGGLPFWSRQGFTIRHERAPTADDMGVVYMDRALIRPSETAHKSRR